MAAKCFISGIEELRSSTAAGNLPTNIELPFFKEK